MESRPPTSASHWRVFDILLAGPVQVSEEACYKTKAHCSGGGEALPKGIIVETTDLQFRSLALESEDKVAEPTLCCGGAINSVSYGFSFLHFFQIRCCSLFCDASCTIYLTWVFVI